MERSIPTSRMRAMAVGSTFPEGREPALAIVQPPPARARAKPSAICDRQEFSTQTKRMLGMTGGYRRGEASGSEDPWLGGRSAMESGLGADKVEPASGIDPAETTPLTVRARARRKE